MKPTNYLVYILFILLIFNFGCCKKSSSTDSKNNKAFNISYESKSKLPDCSELDSVLNGFDIELVDCPAGTFMMGSPSDEVGRGNDEFQHQVTITKPFKIGKYEVTIKQLEVITGKPYVKKENAFQAFRFIGDINEFGDNDSQNILNKNIIPCVCSWNEANEFCQKLNIRFSEYIPKNYHFDLPTEAQWEYACRAGTTTAFNNGKNISSIQPNESSSNVSECVELNDVGWYGYNSGRKFKGQYCYFFQTIGGKKPNNWGIYDMHGNMPEFCKDKYGPYLSKMNIDPYNEKGGHPVVRGGFGHNFAKDCRSASRHRNPHALDFPSAGFRIVLVSND